MKTIKIGEINYKSSGKWIEIQFKDDGEASPYFMNNGRRAMLSGYVRTNGVWGSMPEYYMAGLHAYDSIDSYDFITIDDYGEAVMIWRQVL